MVKVHTGAGITGVGEVDSSPSVAKANVDAPVSHEFAAGPATVISWTSSYSETGVLGEPELATAEKGRRAYEEAVKQLVRFVSWFKDRPKDQLCDRHGKPPTMPIPWGQRPVQ